MIECKHYARGDCGGELCWRGRRPRCSKYQPARKYKAFGWCVTVRFRPDLHEETFHWCGCTENGARRKGMLKTLAQEIVKVEPVSTEQDWVRAFGVPGQRM